MEKENTMSSVETAELTPKEPARCPNCGTETSSDQMFCAVCGTRLDANNQALVVEHTASENAEQVAAASEPEPLKCQNCGTVMKEDQLFCPECGTKSCENPVDNSIAQYNMQIANKQKKKGTAKIIIIIVCAVLVIMAAVGGYLGYCSYVRQQVLAFSDKADEYAGAVKDTKSDLSVVSEAWKIVDDGGSWLYRDSLRSYARSLFSKQISSAKTAKTKITGLYDEIKIVDINNPYVDRIKTQTEVVQEAYLNVYNSVIVDESGYNSTALSTLSTEISELEDIIEEVKNEYGSGE